MGWSAKVRAAVLVAALLTLAGCGGSDGSEDDQPAETGRSSQRTEQERPGPGRSDGAGVPGTFAGEIGGRTLGLITSEALDRQTNGWIISNHRHTTAVEAGGDARNPDNGAFAIFREDIVGVKQRVDLVRVPGTGPVQIVEAPLGRGPVQTWAQKRGEIRFTSKSGITGTLRLRDGSVVLDKG